MRLIDYFEQFNIENRDSLAYSTRTIHYRQAVKAYAECFGEAVNVTNPKRTTKRNQPVFHSQTI